MCPIGICPACQRKADIQNARVVRDTNRTRTLRGQCSVCLSWIIVLMDKRSGQQKEGRQYA